MLGNAKTLFEAAIKIHTSKRPRLRKRASIVKNLSFEYIIKSQKEATLISAEKLTLPKPEKENLTSHMQ